MRSASLALAAFSAIVASLTGCGGGSDGNGGGSTGEESEVDRLGCHEYCQQAGGYGAGGGARAPMIKVAVDAPLVPLGDGTVPVRLTCLVRTPCTGALLLKLPDATDMGRSDLIVGADSARTLGIPLSPFGHQWLEQHASVNALVTADVIQTFESLSLSEQAKVDPINVKEIVLSRSP
jgi:hypothetical protein